MEDYIKIFRFVFELWIEVVIADSRHIRAVFDDPRAGRDRGIQEIERFLWKRVAVEHYLSGDDTFGGRRVADSAVRGRRKLDAEFAVNLDCAGSKIHIRIELKEAPDCDGNRALPTIFYLPLKFHGDLLFVL